VFGDGTDLRLMETVEIAHASTLVITEPRYEISKELAPIAQKKYPNLFRLASVEDEEQRLKFESLSIQAVVDRSFPPGLDIAARVLREHGIEEKKIAKWMQLQQSRALDEKAELEEFEDKVLKAS
jgi:CPA2 family monovalent cation:H+ antiporter-2